MLEQTSTDKFKTIECIDKCLACLGVTGKGTNVEFLTGDGQIESFSGRRGEPNVDFRR